MTINVFLTLSCVVAIFSLLFLVKKIFPKIVGELEKDSKIIDAHWNKEFKNSSPFRETSYLMLGILGSAGSIFWEQILANDFICSLWFCLFTYSLCSFLVFEIVTLIIISICNPLTSNPLTQIGVALIKGGAAGAGVYVIGGVAAELSCTTGLVKPPLHLPGFKALQLNRLGYNAHTSDEVIAGKLYTLSHGGEKPPCIDDSTDINLPKTSKILKEDAKQFFIDIINSSSKEGLIAARKYAVKTTPFIDYILPEVPNPPEITPEGKTPEEEGVEGKKYSLIDEKKYEGKTYTI